MAFDISLPARGTTVSIDFASEAPQDAARLIPVARGEDGLELPVTALAAEGILDALATVGATGKAGETVRVLVDGALYISLGLGDADEIDDEAVRRAFGAGARSLSGVTAAAVSTEFGVGPVVEGLLLGGYAYNGLKSLAEEKSSAREKSTAAEKDEDTQVTVTLVGRPGDGDAEEDVRDEIAFYETIAESVNLARDLVNTPANFLYPESYAAIISEVAQEVGLEVEVFEEDKLRELGFGGILAVGAGSQRAPRLVHLTWNPEGAETKVALVGKGITFDTGGISLKPGAKMEDMISDMGGSAAQFAAIVAAARIGVDLRIDAWLPLAENMPSGSATRPGDVITHYGGKTCEVLNTDAEGRLVLADAIARACEDKPEYLIEAATLTGAQLVALGTRTTAVMGSDEFRDLVAEVGQLVGEPAWPMPLLEEQEEELKSPSADLRNIHNARTGGMCFAGLYLSQFVPEETEWVHMDIAGPAWNGGSAYGYTPKRATGAPVRTIVETLLQIDCGLELADDSEE
ncbi:leucyl aminopeptidase [Corynebacterium aquatimens]|uniref:leucyl aminopeptidase n=1 Tax=Corynebacterium TaxID=1716 RepID=UPI001F410CF7|nr:MULTISPECIES: leucyl aminopeptidase [Corynebacterium]QYH19470.1 leucyl aminopeptidase [Corynebacterium aquatimens]UIZ91607.1 leucyl aminopeptidase [Corynebacterium sp. CNCTC7651]